ncbi:MAG TPA: rhodanese-like domain-containing protein [Chitinophagales bacterium]|nr:rhodanese-like domain-containing protein [Chitinophagales bacterium]
MIDMIKNLLGMGPAVDYKQLMAEGAVIVDVRTKGEYQGGHIKGSVNIPLDTLGGQLKKIDKNKPVITCCASGMRSASAKGLLQSKGYSRVYNGGGWAGLQSKLH